MGKGNNIIPNGHFHKKWRTLVKTCFNQPATKHHRKKNRTMKTRAVMPRPVKLMRPIVQCPTVRYHKKMRRKGFTLTELKVSGLNKKFAKTIGIAVDARRRNKSVECLQTNSHRLKDYKSKLILFPINKKKLKSGDAREKEIFTQVKGEIMPVRHPAQVKAKARVISETEKKFSAYITVRTARADARLVGIRAKYVKDAAESPDEVAKDKKIKK
ncbi:hypothetical protein E2986_08241 [Frieseomelitta varia]|uniref:Large ribosomal subunit protein eL13 n=1 Tax=Frieseomelitta varia TaxID=561572 RepID=A0A833W3M8_9HYME|nr:60S ribosomal protein L13-like [Frieseomelitta varia]XP_043526814.1 60S ribosomal protein L13-like [Frieseomelitta varia]KAF3419803.1 hypothetical protein E2986_08241 [Frieseomelitta varia]